jgi:acetyl-CoA carboxylase biotin carboxyl carrier protein
MDIRKISQLAQLMSTHELSEISFESADVKLLLRRGRLLEVGAAPAPLVSGPLPVATVSSVAPAAAVVAAPTITSPIVGTFYSAPSPEAAPFVRPGDKVGPETVVCIVEAMKVMNEVKAETSGVIRRMLIDNGIPVEFGQPLFELEPA